MSARKKRSDWFVDLLNELNAKREITTQHAREIYGRTYSASTWPRIKKKLAQRGCVLRWDADAKKFCVPRDWMMAPPPTMDPRKRDALATLRVDVTRLGSPFVEGLGQQLDAWDRQLETLDPEVQSALPPPRQPMPRMAKAIYRNLKAAETAVRERRELRFRYRRSKDGRISDRSIYPYDMFNYSGRLYVWGTETTRGKPKFFAIDRMSDVEIGEELVVASAPSLDERLRYSFGMFVDDARSPEKITVEIAPNRVADVEARRWPAEIAREELPDGTLRLTFLVGDFREVVAWVLGFGGDARVLDPPDAAEMARRFAEHIADEHKWAENVPVDPRFLRFDWADKVE